MNPSRVPAHFLGEYGVNNADDTQLGPAERRHANSEKGRFESSNDHLH